MRILSSDIAEIVNGRLIGPPDLLVSEIATDSRQISYTDGLLFIALSGKNHDGHLFIPNLYRQGIRLFLTERAPDDSEGYSDAAFIITENSVDALQQLAAFRRRSFKSPVIAVTGSAGKTIVKEWLSDILGLTTSVIRSPKSYNSQIGVPLSVWKLDDKFKLGIFEAGISFPGEMERLQKIIDPDIGVFTNIGDAHRENFPDDEVKVAEKLKLFVNSTVLIYCSDYKTIRKLIGENENFVSKRIVDWSFEYPGSRIKVKKTLLTAGNTAIQTDFEGRTDHFQIPFTDRASVENAITAVAVCLAIGTPVEIIRKGIAGLISVAMRMEMKSGINNCQLIEDFYNSDPGSLGMAIDYLKTQNNRRTALILSDFIQSGRGEEELYGEVAQLIRRTGIDKFIGIGRALSEYRSLFDRNAKFFSSTDDFIRSFNSADFRDEIILLKGARIFEFEKIATLLEQQIHQTVLEINLDAIAHNLNEFRRFLNPGTKIMAMVKAFAYGAGPSEIAALLEFHRISYLAVAYADEGVELRNAGVSIPVMVMNPDPSASETILRYNLEPEIFSFQSFERFSEVASKHGLINYPVHIKIDTGMHRLGFMPEEIEKLCSLVKTNLSVRVISVFSHLAASEDPAKDQLTKKQVDLFLKVSAQLCEAAGYPIIRHILNSSGIARFPEYQFEMVRPGIGMYGVGSFKGLNLRSTGRFKTKISQIKKIGAGEPVGYGFSDFSKTERIIAILPVGYADGLNRRLGMGNGNLFIRGVKVPIIGNVCMDMCMADITGVNAVEGDEAEIFGDNISIEELAMKCQTIPYEILTSVPGRVKRVFFRE